MNSIYSLTRIAREMEVPRQFAVNARRRYINQRLDEIDEECTFLGGHIDEDPASVNAAFAAPKLADLLIEKCRLLREVQFLKTNMAERPREITEDMVERARQYPINQLVEFRHGKATAWCHEDHNPSLYHGTRTNRAVCPVCGKTFDPIGVLMMRDGVDFKAAVRLLS